MNSKDRKAVGEKLVKAANKQLNGGKLILSEQTIETKGGFVIKNEAFEINSTIEVMIDSVREEVTPDVMEVLFGNKDE